MVITFLLFLATTTVLVLFLSSFTTKRKTNTFGPSPLFFVKGTLSQLHQLILRNKVTGFGHVLIGPKLAMFAVDPNAAQFLLVNSKPERGIVKNVIPIPTSPQQMVAPSFIFQNGTVWRNHRLIVNSGFTEAALRGYTQLSYSVMHHALDKISATLPADHVIDGYSWASKVTLDTLGLSIFGKDFGMIDGKPNPYYLQFQAIFHRTAMDDLIDRFHIPFVKNNLKIASEKIREISATLIAEKLKLPSDSSNDVLTKLVHSTVDEQKLTQEELVADIFTFFLAGHETTATTLTSALGELAVHQDVQEKLFQEISREITVSEPSYDKIKSLEYLNCFLSENLRLHTPIGLLLSREATEDLYYDPQSNASEDTTEDEDGKKPNKSAQVQFIPKGTLLAINFHSLHRDPRHWDQPEKFMPDRFRPENSKGRHRYAYIPFSSGLRQCIGMNFSLFEQRIFIVKILQKWKILPPDNEAVLTHTRGNFFFDTPVVKVKLVPRI